MNTRCRTQFAVLLMAPAIATPLAAQSIQGRLLEVGRDRPVPAASVRLLTEAGDPAAQVLTDSLGRFELRGAQPGTYRIRAERLGYRTAVSPTIELRDDDRVELTMRLSPDAIALAPITVTAHSRRPPGLMGGFYERQKLGFGHFITRDQIEREATLEVTDLLRRVPGLVMTPARYGLGYDVRTISGCTPTVYLDGMRFPLMGESIDDIVFPMAVQGIEVYTRPAEVPVQYAGLGGNCGVILLWTHT